MKKIVRSIRFPQSGDARARCSSSQYVQKMIGNLAAAQGESGDVQCCFKDGCNWNLTTTTSNLAFSEFTNSSSASGLANMAGETDVVPFVLIGLVGLTVIFCFCCFCCIWWREN